MNSPDPEGAVDSTEAPRRLSLDTRKNPETDIVSDYFKDHNYIKMAMGMFNLGIEGTIKSILAQIPGWRIKTYKQYYSDYQGGAAYYETDLAKKSIPLIDSYAAILNEEIANCESGGVFDENRFRAAWNQTNLAVYGYQFSKI